MRVLGETLTVTQVRHKTNLLQRNELLSKKTIKVGPRFTRINKRHRVHEKKRCNILVFCRQSLLSYEVDNPFNKCKHAGSYIIFRKLLKTYFMNGSYISIRYIKYATRVSSKERITMTTSKYTIHLITRHFITQGPDITKTIHVFSSIQLLMLY